MRGAPTPHENVWIVKAKPHEVRARLQKPPEDIRLYLLHGPDEAAANELAELLGRALGPETERIDFDGAALRSQPGRLADEAASMSLFGERRYIRVTGAGEETLEALTLLLNADRAGNPVVVIAPAVRNTAKIVKLAQGAPNAMAAALYLPEGADAAKLAAGIARDHGIRLAPDAADALARGCGADRTIITREVEKLALYLDAAPDRPKEADTATLAEIGAVIDEGQFGDAIEALVNGDAARLGEEMRTLIGAGTSPVPLLRQMGKRLIVIADMRAQIEAGASPDQVLARVFWKEKDATARALRRWDSAHLARGLERVREAERAVMSSGNAGTVVAEQAVVVLARAVARLR